MRYRIHCNGSIYFSVIQGILVPMFFYILVIFLFHLDFNMAYIYSHGKLVIILLHNFFYTVYTHSVGKRVSNIFLVVRFLESNFEGVLIHVPMFLVLLTVSHYRHNLPIKQPLKEMNYLYLEVCPLDQGIDFPLFCYTLWDYDYNKGLFFINFYLHQILNKNSNHLIFYNGMYIVVINSNFQLKQVYVKKRSNFIVLGIFFSILVWFVRGYLTEKVIYKVMSILTNRSYQRLI